MATRTRCLVCGRDNPDDARICLACGASLTGDPAGGFTSALPPGTRLRGGDYAVGKMLGQGGFGITYLGSDTRLRRPVAIKEFFPYGCIRRTATVQPSGSMTHPNFPYSESSVFSSTSQPSSRSA